MAGPAVVYDRFRTAIGGAACLSLIESNGINSVRRQEPAVFEPGERDRDVVARGVLQWFDVRTGQSEELLDGRRRDTHTVRVGADGHMRGRSRKY